MLNTSNTLVVYPGDDIYIRCSINSIYEVISIEWILNGTALNDLSLDNVTANLNQEQGKITSGNLRIISVPIEYVRTTIECRVTLMGLAWQVSDNVVLLVQG